MAPLLRVASVFGINPLSQDPIVVTCQLSDRIPYMKAAVVDIICHGIEHQHNIRLNQHELECEVYSLGVSELESHFPHDLLFVAVAYPGAGSRVRQYLPNELYWTHRLFHFVSPRECAEGEGEYIFNTIRVKSKSLGLGKPESYSTLRISTVGLYTPSVEDLEALYSLESPH